MFRIADLEFTIIKAKLEVYVGTSDLNWGILIEAKSNDVSRPDLWCPKLSSDALFTTRAGEVSDWQAVLPRAITWTEPHENIVTPSATLYVWEHCPIYACTARLTFEAGKVCLHLSASCDVFYDTASYYDDLPLEVITALDFVVLCGRDSEAEARERIAPFLDHSALHFSQDSEGVSILTSPDV